jgi:hypothetical protein
VRLLDIATLRWLRSGEIRARRRVVRSNNILLLAFACWGICIVEGLVLSHAERIDWPGRSINLFLFARLSVVRPA